MAKKIESTLGLNSAEYSGGKILVETHANGIGETEALSSLNSVKLGPMDLGSFKPLGLDLVHRVEFFPKYP